MTGPAIVLALLPNTEDKTMPVLIIGGSKPDEEEERKTFPAMRKRMEGIGGKYASEKEDESESEASMDTGKRKLEASKLMLRAIKMNDPQLVAEAITTLVESCSEEGDGAGPEYDNDSGEME